MRPKAAQAIRRRARVVRQNLWMILGVGLLFAAIGNITQPPPENRYIAGAHVDPGGIQEQVLLVYQFAARPDPLKHRVAEAAETALSREVITNASLRLRNVPDDVEITAVGAGLTGRVGIAVTSEDPRQAARIANVVAEEFAKARNREFRSRLADISRELRAARSDAGIPPRNVDLVASLTRYATEQYQTRVDMLRQFAEPAIVAKRASVPTQPIVVLPWAGMIFLLGVGLATTAAFLREALRSRREDPHVAAAIAGVQALGVLEGPEAGALVSFVSDIGSEPARVAVCGLRPSDRSLAVAAALASATAAQGSRTVLVEADPARPRIAARLGLDALPGVDALLSGAATPEEVLRPTTGADGLAGPQVAPVGKAGHAPPGGLRPAVAHVARGFDVVVVAVPSPLESAELTLLAPELDRILIVAERELRGEDELRAIGRQLAALPVPAALVLADAAVERALLRGALGRAETVRDRHRELEAVG